MKTKLKSMSKRTLSIILVLLMVVSTITVGVLTTTAAYTDKDDNTVGATVNDDSRVGDADLPQDQYINVKLISDHWIKVDGGETGEIDISSYHTDEKIYFDLYGTKYNGGPEVWFNVGGGINATQDQNYTFGTGGSSGNNQNFITVKDKGKIKIKSSYENGSVKLSISSASGSSAGPVETDYYVAGTLNSWAPTEADKMDASGTTYTKTYENVPAGTHELKVKTTIGDSGGTWYGGQNPTSITGTAISKNDYTINDNDNVKFDTNKTANITVTFDGSSKRITSIVANIAQKSVASSVALTVNPSSVKLGSKVREIKATTTGLDAGVTHVTYTFKTNDTTIATVNKMGADKGTCTVADIETGASAAAFPSDNANVFTALRENIHVSVTVSTTDQYNDNGSQKAYMPVSADTTFNIDNGNIYYTAAGAGAANPNWTALTNKSGVNTITENVSTLTDSGAGFTFALSDEDNFSETFGKYTISQEDCAYCSVTEGRKSVGEGETAFTVFTYTVKPLAGYVASTPTLYIDTATKKVYAKASFDKTTGSLKTGDIDKTVRYYFAKKYDQSSAIDGRNHEMWIHYWNNSFGAKDGHSGYTSCTPVKVDGTAGDKASDSNTTTSIYVESQKLRFRDGDAGGFGTSGADRRYEVYYADLPVWATTVALNTNSSGDVTGTDNSAVINTLNPNRIYLWFNYRNYTRFSGVPLDTRFWTNDVGSRTHPNEADEQTFYANAVRYNRTQYDSNHDNYFNVNRGLSDKYSGTTTTPLYFGNFWNVNNKESSKPNEGKADNTWTGFNWTANIAMRWGDETSAADGKKYIGGCPYYATIWDLVGMRLDTTKNNGMGGYVLRNYDESAVHPLFDYEMLKGNNVIASNVFQKKNFPFVKSTYDGITTYSYDSQVDPNRAITKTGDNGNTATDDFAVEHDTYYKVGSMLGYKPFKNYGDQAYSFANEFDIDFNLTSSGTIKGKRGSTSYDEDIVFNFSGDDDVWVFVDGVLVLDLGGDHMPSAGSINFSKMKVYYKSAAESIKNLSANFAGETDLNDFSNDYNKVLTLDLQMILDSASPTGTKFNNKDASTQHKLQMFYLERGQNESNCSLSFNLPQATGLNLRSVVETNDVNPGLVEKALMSANKDAFRYNVAVKLANDTEWSNLTTAYNTLDNTRKFDTNQKAAILNALDTEPKYPSVFDAWRIFTQGSETMKGKLSSISSSGSAAATNLSDITTSYSTISNQTFELSDVYGNTESKDPIAGKPHTTASNGYAVGDFNLLTGQKITFNNQIPANTMIRLYQNKDLDEALYTGDDALIGYQTVAMNEVYDYYRTSYDIYDNQYKYYVKEKDDASSKNSIYANDNSTNENSFYFTNYTTDTKVNSPAMTVTYYNDINVGKIKIEKELVSGASSDNAFNFKVFFKNVFGYDVAGDEASWFEAPHLVYHRYYKDGTPVFATDTDDDPEIPYDMSKGISIRANEYAVIEGVPVETQFKIAEATAAGYELSTIVKRCEKANNEDVVYLHRGNADDSVFANKQIYYERIDYNTKQYLMPPEGDMELDETLAATHSTSERFHEIPNGNGNDTDKYYINTIPIRTQSDVPSSGEYESTSRVTFTNKRDGIDITFNYYPRVVTTGETAHISSIPDSYTFSIEDLYEKDDQGNYKYVTLQGEDIKEIKFDEMIAAALKDFNDCNGGVFTNVIDEYQFFASQKDAQEAFFDGDTRKIDNPSLKADRTEYTKQNTVYHMDYISQPLTGTLKESDKWVSYFKDKDMTQYFDAEAVPPESDEEATAAYRENLKSLKKINLWLYNTPRLYQVKYVSASENENNTSFNQANTYNHYYVGNDSIMASQTLSFYYNQRYGDIAIDEDPNNPEVLSFLGPNEYDFSSYTGQTVSTAEEVLVNGEKLKFLYWSFDPDGYSKASDDIRYLYRVTTSYTLYPVYGTETQYNQFKNAPGLSVSLNGEDSYFDKSGVARRRLNVLASPYNCPNYDNNIYSMSVIYITLTDAAKALCLDDGGNLDEYKVNQLYKKYKDQLVSLISINQSKFTGKVNTAIDSITYELDVTGFRHDINQGNISPAVLTNKNRAQFSTTFKVSGTNGMANQTLIATATMLYYNASESTASWLVSDNAVAYEFSPNI